jgi:chaperonin cofactor prefoldin
LASKDESQKELTAWRASHFAELEATLRVFKEVRDDPEASNKDRIEAGKSIGRLLSAMAPEKVSSATTEEKDSTAVTIRNIPTLPPALRKRLKAITNAKPD